MSTALADTLLCEALAAIVACNSSAALEEERVTWLGKKGRLTEALKTLGAADPQTRKTLGAALNKVKQEIIERIEARKAELSTGEIESQLAREQVDVTLPARPWPQGKIHPISHTMEEIRAIFARMGFAIAEGPDIEDDFHNFTALNIPESHPARQMHDTFYLRGSENDAPRPLLRTHTSPVQIRTMRANKPPMRFIAPGNTYRCDSDQTHTPMFHQVEGFAIGRGIHMGHLRGCIVEFLKAFFEMDDVPVRFRPSFFPFTEPSAEVDIGCARGKESIQIGAGDDWLEVMGCGMIHPTVLKNGSIDPEQWQGFAFGLGVERLAMLKYGIADLRTFFEADARWLKHYGFFPLGEAA